MSIDLSPPGGYAAGNLAFSDNFSGHTLNPASWNPFVGDNNSGGSAWFGNGAGGSAIGGAGSFNAEYNLPSHATVNDGLSLTATPTPTTAGGTTYPYTSGVVSTVGKMEFTGGYVQVSMQEAGGDGAWPAIWMLPGVTAGTSNHAEIDIQEGGFKSGSVNPNDVMAASLHPAGGGSTTTTLYDAHSDLSAGYHTYGLDWEPGQSLTWYLDGAQVKQVTGSGVPNFPMELIIDNSVANQSASGWHTTYDSSTPNPLTTSINDVQIYQHAGETITGGNVPPGGLPPPVTPPPPPVTPPPPVVPPGTDHHHHHHDWVGGDDPQPTSNWWRRWWRG